MSWSVTSPAIVPSESRLAQQTGPRMRPRKSAKRGPEAPGVIRASGHLIATTKLLGKRTAPRHPNRGNACRGTRPSRRGELAREQRLRTDGCSPAAGVDGVPNLQMHLDLVPRLLSAWRVRPVDLDHASAGRVRRKPGTPEVSAQIVQKRGIVKEDKHGPQSQSSVSRRPMNRASPCRGAHPMNNTTTTITPAPRESTGPSLSTG